MLSILRPWSLEIKKHDEKSQTGKAEDQSADSLTSLLAYSPVLEVGFCGVELEVV